MTPFLSEVRLQLKVSRGLGPSVSGSAGAVCLFVLEELEVRVRVDPAGKFEGLCCV